MDDSVLLAPALALGDVYIYAHGNGAVSVLQAGSDHDVVTLATALTMARTSHDAGHDVWVGGDDQPLAVNSLTAIGTLGIHPEAFAAPAPRSSGPAAPRRSWRPPPKDAPICARPHRSRCECA